MWHTLPGFYDSQQRTSAFVSDLIGSCAMLTAQQTGQEAYGLDWTGMTHQVWHVYTLLDPG